MKSYIRLFALIPLVIILAACSAFSPAKVTVLLPIDTLTIKQNSSTTLTLNLTASNFSADSDSLSFRAELVQDADNSAKRDNFTGLLTALTESWECESDNGFCTYVGKETRVEAKFDYKISLTGDYPVSSSELKLSGDMCIKGCGFTGSFRSDSKRISLKVKAE